MVLVSPFWGQNRASKEAHPIQARQEKEYPALAFYLIDRIIGCSLSYSLIVVRWEKLTDHMEGFQILL